jgi:uncharacterized membrane protein YheB (UPF0754 family)
MIIQIIRDLIPWLTPPIIGAIIGYVTNDIAIRMLFRPLATVRIFGLRLPFTPGIFPKERHVLSRSIGRMVSKELITEDALRRQIRSEKTQVQLTASVSELSARLLSTTFSGLSGSLNGVISSSLEQFVRELINRFLGSRDIIYAVRDIISRAVSSISASNAGELIERWGLPSFVSERLLPLLADPSTRESLTASAAEAVGSHAGELVSDSLISALTDILMPLLDPAVDRLVEWLHSEEMERELERQGRKLVSDILEKLNLLQRFILTAGQFDRRLDEKMPEIVGDTIATVESLARDPANQRRALAIMGKAVRDWRGRAEPDGAAAAKGGAGQAVALLVDALLAELAKPDLRRKIAHAMESLLLKDGDPTMGRVLNRVLGLREEEIVDRLSTLVLDYLSRKETADLVSSEIIRFVTQFLRNNAETPVGEVLGIDSEKKGKLDSFLTGRLIALVDAKMPEILSGIDVERLVVEKIDALDVRDVERLIREVIATHLRWIDVFGAILGAVIGLFQVLLRILHLS